MTELAWLQTSFVVATSCPGEKIGPVVPCVHAARVDNFLRAVPNPAVPSSLVHVGRPKLAFLGEGPTSMYALSGTLTRRYVPRTNFGDTRPLTCMCPHRGPSHMCPQSIGTLTYRCGTLPLRPTSTRVPGYRRGCGHCVLTVYSLCTHCVLTVYSLCTHCVLTVYSLRTHCELTVNSL